MELDCLWGSRRGVSVCVLIGFTSFLLQTLIAVSLNHEGMALLRFKERIENDPFGAMLNWKESSLENDHCSWYGVDCVDGHVVSLKLRDLCIAGVLPPEIGQLVHIKLIVLRNNSLSGTVPEELAGLKELEVLDLGFNNFSGPLPLEWGNNVAVLLLDNNGQFCHVPPEVEQLMMLSELQVEESDLSPISKGSSYNVDIKSSCFAEHSKALSRAFMRCDHQTKDYMHRRELRDTGIILKDANKDIGVSDGPPPSPSRPSPPSPTASPSPPSTPASPSPPLTPASPSPPSPLLPQASPSPSPPSLPSPSASAPTSPPPPPPPPSASASALPPSPPLESPPSGNKNKSVAIAVSASVGGFALLAVLVALLLWRHKKNATGGLHRELSGRIQSSAVNGDDKVQILSREITTTGLTQGIANLKRSELEDACEDFSNVIGWSSIGTLYKGTLSSGGEVAVLSYALKHAEDWSNEMQMLFMKKVDKLSKVSHKNFLNLVGYCEDENPFTRMLVFEYAPSGTLFEHLYVRESEHLDWTMRLRIMMGITYCVEHMHTLTPYVTHEDLTAYSVTLSEDYAAKLSAFGIWNEVALAARPLPVLLGTITSPEIKPEDNVYSLGIVLLEMITGKAPHSMGLGSLDDWALDFLRGEKPLKDFVDPMLRHFDGAQLERIGEVLKSCTLLDPNERPKLVDVAARLREITDVAPERAAPRLSLWWP